MTYEINSKNLTLNLKNNEKAFFKHNKNIINYESLLKDENNKNSNDFKKAEESKEINKNDIIISEIDENPANLTNKEMKLNNLYKKGIIALYEFYNFSQEIKNQISSQKNENNYLSFFFTECYLIKEDWFSKYKNFYSYTNLYRITN
jgi:hypothetical protein